MLQVVEHTLDVKNSAVIGWEYFKHYLSTLDSQGYKQNNASFVKNSILRDVYEIWEAGQSLFRWKIQRKTSFRSSKLIFNYVCARVFVCESLFGWPLIYTALNASLN